MYNALAKHSTRNLKDILQASLVVFNKTQVLLSLTRRQAKHNNQILRCFYEAAFVLINTKKINLFIIDLKKINLFMINLIKFISNKIIFILLILIIVI